MVEVGQEEGEGPCPEEGHDQQEGGGEGDSMKREEMNWPCGILVTDLMRQR